MPIDHYVDEEYRYLLFRQYRYLPPAEHATAPDIPWNLVRNLLQIWWQAVYMFVLAAVHKI